MRALLWLTLFSLPALAQSPKVTIIDFKNEVIEGTLDTPDLEVTRGQTRWEHAKLVQVRKNFRDAVLGSVSRL